MVYKIIIFLFLFCGIKSFSQKISIDTTSRYDFFIVINDTAEFRKCERIIYNSLVGNINMNASIWCEKQQDTVTKKYLCNVPSDNRIIKIKELEPILIFLGGAKQDTANIELYKNLMLNTDIPIEWKKIIEHLEYIKTNDIIIIK